MMSPQPFHEKNIPSVSPVCDQVRSEMNAICDNRATPAERLFVFSHVERCAGCASAWAFVQAAKAAWARTPDVVPPASLSARIAAATYRKPTFAERFLAAFAFLSLAPARVAIGVVAVAGIGFFVLPRLNEPTPTTPVADSAPKPAANDAKKIVSDVKPVPAPVVVAKPARSKPQAVVKPTVIAAVRSVESPKPPVAASIVARSVSPAAAKIVAKPVQVAAVPHKIAQRRGVGSPIESLSPQTRLPASAEVAEVATMAVPQPMVPVEKPHLKEPEAVPNVPVVASLTVGEHEPTTGYIRLNLSNAGRRSIAGLSGGAAALMARPPETGIVSAPIQ